MKITIERKGKKQFTMELFEETYDAVQDLLSDKEIAKKIQVIRKRGK